MVILGSCCYRLCHCTRTKQMEQIFAEALFSSREVNGEKEYLIRKDDLWMWKPAKNIANIDIFTTNLNPLSCLLNDSHDGVFQRKKEEVATMSPDFDFGETDNKIFVLNPFTETPFLIPFNNPETKEESSNDLSTAAIYQMAEKIATVE